MTPAEAIELFMPRYEAFEARVDRRFEVMDKEIDELTNIVAVLTKESELVRKSLDRFTNALLVGSLSIVGAAVAVILFGPNV